MRKKILIVISVLFVMIVAGLFVYLIKTGKLGSKADTGTVVAGQQTYAWPRDNSFSAFTKLNGTQISGNTITLAKQAGSTGGTTGGTTVTGGTPQTALLSPTGDSQKQWLSYQGTVAAATKPSWDMVNDSPTGNADNMVSYIKSGTGVTQDLYNFDSSSIPDGSKINSVSIKTFAKGDLTYTGTLNLDGTNYQHAYLFPAGQVVGVWKNADFSWTTNPATKQAFTASEVKNLKFGVYSNYTGTPTLITRVYLEVNYTPQTVVVPVKTEKVVCLKPIQDSVVQLKPNFGGANWEMVDDGCGGSDGDSTYIESVQSPSNVLRDHYIHEAMPAIPDGSEITKVSIDVAAKGSMSYQAVIMLNSEHASVPARLQDGGPGDTTSNWWNSTFSWTNNPETNQPFTVSDIANMKFGVLDNYTGSATQFSQVNLNVYYTESGSGSTDDYVLSGTAQLDDFDFNGAGAVGDGVRVLSASFGQNYVGVIKMEYSKDNGANWTTDIASLGMVKKLSMRATLETADPKLTPILGSVIVNYVVPSKPEKPVITAPTDGATTNLNPAVTLNGVFTDTDGGTWKSTVCELSVDSIFSSQALLPNVTGNLTSCTLPTLTSGTKYYLRAAYMDSDGEASSAQTVNWSDVVSFTAQGTRTVNLPDKPILKTPLNNAILTNGATTQTLEVDITKWNSTSGSTHTGTWWQICSDSACNNVSFEKKYDSVFMTSYTEILGGNGAKYYWRAKYKDSNTVESSWSDIWSFTVGVQTVVNKPNTPVNEFPLPTNNTIVDTVVLAATGFLPSTQTPQSSHWQVANSSADLLQGKTLTGGELTYSPSAAALKSAVANINLCTLNDHIAAAQPGPDDCVITLANKFDPTLTYYWRVQYQNTLGNWSDWSTPTTFKTQVPCKPNQPTLKTPADNATVYELRPKLDANAFSTSCNIQNDPLSDFKHAYWQVAYDDQFTKWVGLSNGIAAPVASYVPNFDLTAGTKYYWRVVYEDGNGQSATSSAWSFTVDKSAGQPPVQPFNIKPTNYEQIPATQTDVVLQASAFDQPNKASHASSTWTIYSVVNGNISSVINRYTPTGGGSTTFTLPGLVMPGQTYAWTVAYTDSDGRTSANSDATYFTIEVENCAPDQPILDYPIDGYGTNSQSPQLAAKAFNSTCGATFAFSQWEISTDKNAFANGYIAGLLSTNTPVITYTPNIDLAPGDYYWRVTYVDNRTQKSTSDIRKFTITPQTRSVMAAPTEVKLVSPTTDGFNVTWVDNSSNEKGFKVYTAETSLNCDLATNYVLVGATGANVANLNNITGGKANTRYCAKVVATDNTIDSAPAFSSDALYTLAIVPGLTVVGDYNATDGNFFDVTINSNGNAAGTNYYLDFTNSDIRYTSISNVKVADWLPGLTYRVKTIGTYPILSNDTQLFAVKARNQDLVETSAATAYSTTPPAAPTNLKSLASGKDVTLSWTTAPGAVGYILDYSEASDMTNSKTLTVIGDNTTITGLINDKTYYWRIKSVGSNSKTGPYSNPIESFMSVPCVDAPTNFKGSISIFEPDKVKWTWSKIGSVNPNTKYYVNDRNGGVVNPFGTTDSYYKETINSTEVGNTKYTRYVQAEKMACANSNMASIYTLAKTPDAPAVNYYSDSQAIIALHDTKNSSDTTYAIKVNGKFVQPDGSLTSVQNWVKQNAWQSGMMRNGILVNGFVTNQTYTIEVIAKNSDNKESKPVTIKYTFKVEPAQVSLRTTDNLMNATLYEQPDQAKFQSNEKTYFLELTRPVDEDILVDIKYSGTAIMNADYEIITPETIKIAKGKTSSEIFFVKIKADNLYEDDEKIEMLVDNISNSVKVVKNTDIASTIIIKNSNPQPKLQSITLSKSSISQLLLEKADLEVKLDQVSGVDTKVRLDYFGFAIPTVDFESPDFIVIPAGSISSKVVLSSLFPGSYDDKKLEIRPFAQNALNNPILLAEAVLTSSSSLPAPTGVKIAEGSVNNSIKVSWTDNSIAGANEQGFNIYLLKNSLTDCDKSAYDAVAPILVDQDRISKEILDIQPGAKYCAKVTAKYDVALDKNVLSTPVTSTVESKPGYSSSFYSKPNTPSIFSIDGGFDTSYFAKIKVEPAGNSYTAQYEVNYNTTGDFAGPNQSVAPASLDGESSVIKVENLKPDTKYWFKVRAVNNVSMGSINPQSVTSNWSEAKDKTTPPPPPSNIQLTNLCGDASSWIFNTGRFTISWLPYASATKYQIEYGVKNSKTGQFQKKATIDKPDILTFMATHMDNGDNYVKIAAINGNGQGAFSAEQKVNLRQTFGGSCYSPQAAEGFKGETISITEINWSWSEKAGRNGQYTLHDGITNNVIPVAVLPPFAEKSYEGNLIPNTSYTRYVKVTDGVNSNNSNQATVYTLAQAPTLIAVNEAAGGVRVTLGKTKNPSYTKYAIKMATKPGTKDLNSIAWLKPDGSSTASEVWATYAEWGGDKGFVTTNFAPSTKYNWDPSMVNDSNYYFAAKAINNAMTPVETVLSAEQKVTIPVNTDPNKFVVYSLLTKGASVDPAKTRLVPPANMIVENNKTAYIRVYSESPSTVSFLDCPYGFSTPTEDACMKAGAQWQLAGPKDDKMVSEYKVDVNGQNRLIYYKVEKTYEYKLNVIGGGTAQFSNIKNSVTNPPANPFILKPNGSFTLTVKPNNKAANGVDDNFVIDSIKAEPIRGGNGGYKGCARINDRVTGFSPNASQTKIDQGLRLGSTYDFSDLTNSCEITVVFKKDILTVTSSKETKTPQGLPFWKNIGVRLANLVVSAADDLNLPNLVEYRITKTIQGNTTSAVTQRNTKVELFRALSDPNYQFVSYLTNVKNPQLNSKIETYIQDLGGQVSAKLKDFNDTMKVLRENHAEYKICYSATELPDSCYDICKKDAKPIDNGSDYDSETCVDDKGISMVSESGYAKYKNALENLKNHYNLAFDPLNADPANMCTYKNPQILYYLFALNDRTDATSNQRYNSCFDLICQDSETKNQDVCKLRSELKAYTISKDKDKAVFTTLGGLVNFDLDLLNLAYDKRFVTFQIPPVEYYNNANYFSNFFQDMATKVSNIIFNSKDITTISNLAQNNARQELMNKIALENDKAQKNQVNYGSITPPNKWFYAGETESKQSDFLIDSDKAKGFIVTEIEDYSKGLTSTTKNALQAKIVERISSDSNNIKNIATAFAGFDPKTPVDENAICNLCRVVDMENIVTKIVKDKNNWKQISTVIKDKKNISEDIAFNSISRDDKNNYVLSYIVNDTSGMLGSQNQYVTVPAAVIEAGIGKYISVSFTGTSGENKVAINNYNANSAVLRLEDVTNNHEIKAYYSFNGKISELFDFAAQAVIDKINQQLLDPMAEVFDRIFKGLVLNDRQYGGRGQVLSDGISNVVNGSLNWAKSYVQDSFIQNIFGSIGGVLTDWVAISLNQIDKSSNSHKDISWLTYWVMQ